MYPLVNYDALSCGAKNAHRRPPVECVASARRSGDGGANELDVTEGEIVGHPRLRLIGDQSNGIFNLRITDASLTDDGEYECQVGRYLRIKPIRASAHLIVTCESRFKSILLISPTADYEIPRNPIVYLE